MGTLLKVRSQISQKELADPTRDKVTPSAVTPYKDFCKPLSPSENTFCDFELTYSFKTMP